MTETRIIFELWEIIMAVILLTFLVSMAIFVHNPNYQKQVLVGSQFSYLLSIVPKSKFSFFKLDINLPKVRVTEDNKNIKVKIGNSPILSKQYFSNNNFVIYSQNDKVIVYGN